MIHLSELPEPYPRAGHRIGRTAGFFVDQLYVGANAFTLPLGWAGCTCCSSARQTVPLIGLLYVLTLAAFGVMQGRGYYMAGAYPMLLAAGAVAWERWMDGLPAGRGRVAMAATWTCLAVGALVFAPLTIPLTPVNSAVWNAANEIHDNFSEQLGWHELVETVASVYESLPAEERAKATIFAGNYGEAGALNLYGPELGLPEVISSINSWLRTARRDRGCRRGGGGVEQAEEFLRREWPPGQNRYGVENEKRNIRRADLPKQVHKLAGCLGRASDLRIAARGSATVIAMPVDLTKLDADVRYQVYDSAMRTGAIPDSAVLAAKLGCDRATVLASLRRLAEARMLVLQRESGEILMAIPFSGVPTAFQVSSGGRISYGIASGCIGDRSNAEPEATINVVWLLRHGDEPAGP
jgi:hypothetical protein